jgi:DNA modification methylase
MSNQLALFNLNEIASNENQIPDYGTFKDSLRAPIHSWFRYPAGYSYKFVDETFAEVNMKPGMWVYDPFSGSGTTLLCAQQTGVNGYGVEAHSFVHWVAGVKLFQDYDWSSLGTYLHDLIEKGAAHVKSGLDSLEIADKFPELVYKCYHPQDLKELYLLREFIGTADNLSIRNLAKLALTDTLRSSAAAGTGWPYIAPRKNTGEAPPKGAQALFRKTLLKMYADLKKVAARPRPDSSQIMNVLGDSRLHQPMIADGQIDLALTSPPYLNNFDYADRTRLETYFWGITHTWADITRDFRSKLIVSATTQIVRKKFDLETVVSKEIEGVAPDVYTTIQNAVRDLSVRRTLKGGKKDYDLMVALYFNDIFRVLKETYRILRQGASFYLVLGDSAPYGVHIATDNLIGQLGLALGFTKFDYRNFRARGGKWKANPQRHDVELREGVIILKK